MARVGLSFAVSFCILAGMYVLDLFFDHARTSGSGAIHVHHDARAIAQWTFLPASSAGLEQLRLISLACAGRPQARKLMAGLGADVVMSKPGLLRLEARVALHHPRDGDLRAKGSVIRGCGLELSPESSFHFLSSQKFKRLPRSTPSFTAQGRRTHRHFFLAYGAQPASQTHTVFDFSDPWHLLSRFASLFSPAARLSNPVMVLEWIRDKGIRLSRFPKRKTLERLSAMLARHLHLDAQHWLSLDCRLDNAWEQLTAGQRNALTPVLDMARHALDANPRSGYPLDEPVLILLDRPDRYCPQGSLPAWFDLLSALFPRGQFIVTLPAALQGELSVQVNDACLDWPEVPTPKPQERHAEKAGLRHNGGGVALVHVDGNLPNFALMKISGYFKSQRRRVELFKIKPADGVLFDEIWASCIFHMDTSQARLRYLQGKYGDRLRLGGSGVDIEQRLPREMEAAEPDYDLYPSLEDRAIGFLTRGCTNNCAFCIVPRKEGTVRQVADLDELLRGRNKLILLDDNILAHHSGPDFLAEMAKRDIAVNFNQTLDLRLVDVQTARLLRRVRAMNVIFTRPCLHFSLNNAENLETIRRKYELLGFKSRDNVEFICMYGYNTTLEEDVARFRFLRSLPGAYVFTQRYRPFPGAPRPAEVDYFGPNPDPLLDELVRIIFPQNMKSMEIYYRWISRLYAEKYGRLHKNLVDTTFRYNHRDLKGRYLVTLAGTRPMPDFG